MPKEKDSIDFPVIPGYTIREMLHDGRSQIFRGIIDATSRPVILKMPRDVSAWANKKLDQEFEMGHRFTGNPYIADYLATTHYKGKTVIVMTDTDAISFEKFIGEKTPTLKQLISVAIQLSKGLEIIHNMDVFHRDIKPQNIVITVKQDDFTVQYIDFDLSVKMKAVASQELYSSDMAIGTLQYIAPEQTGRMGRAVDYRADFYSLGVVLYNLFCKCLPFEVVDQMQLVHCHLAVQPKSPHEINTTLPEVISNIIMKLMAKEADARYQSAGGLTADLTTCLTHLEKGDNIPIFTLGQEDIAKTFSIPQKLYGRDAELQVLHTIFMQTATTGESKLLTVSGPSGTGKTALVDELRRLISSRNGYFIYGKGEQVRQSFAYGIFTPALQSLLKHMACASDAVLQQLRKKLAVALGTNAQLIINIVPELEIIIGKQPEVSEVEAIERKNRFEITFAKFISVFADETQPLVIFIDDLQYADFSSIELIKTLIKNSDLRYVLIVGAYRDDELTASCPLATMIAGLKQKGGILQNVSLNALTVADINQLLVDATRRSLEEVAPLADFLFKKTAGNIFLIRAFLQHFYKEDLLSLTLVADSHSCKKVWSWDVIKLECASIPTDLVGLMQSKLQLLDMPILELLKTAACFGDTFVLDELACMAGKDSDDLAPLLDVALEKGVIVRIATNSYRFSHEKIRKIIYEQIPEPRKVELHSNIGMILQNKLSPEEIERDLFSIINHLNLGCSLLATLKDKYELAELNLKAGKKAKVANAYKEAVQYLEKAMQLLDENAWKNKYGLIFAIHKEAMECFILLGNFSKASEIQEVALNNVKDIVQKGQLYVIDLMQKAVQGKYADVIQLGVKILSLLGVRLPQFDASDKEIAATIEQGQQWYHEHWTKLNKQICELSNLPISNSPEDNMIMTVFAATFNSALVLSIPYLKLLTTVAVNYAIEHGNTNIVPVSYALHSTVLAAAGEYETAYQFGRLSLALNQEKLHNKAIDSKLYNTFSSIAHIKTHFSERYDICTKGYEAGLKSGDLVYAASNMVNRMRGTLFAGLELSAFVKEAEEDLLNVEKSNYIPMREFGKIYRCFGLTLQGKTKTPDTFDCDNLNEKSFLETFAKVVIGTSCLYLYKIVVHCILSEYSKALPLIEKIDLEVLSVHADVEWFYFYASLTLLKCYPTNSGEQQACDEKVRKYHSTIQGLAASCPVNFKAHDLLLQAEISRAKDQLPILEIIKLYDGAIAASQEGKLIHNEALACGLAAEFCYERKLSTIALGYLIRSFTLYGQWGATIKVAELTRKHSLELKDLLHNKKHSQSHTSDSSTNQSLDLQLVVQAAQTIANEVDLKELSRKLMEAIMQNAGAQKVTFLLSEDNGSLSVVAEANVADKKVGQSELLQIVPFDLWQGPHAIINYVKRCKESLVLTDASEHEDYRTDPYIQRNKTKSVLCTPVIHQSTLLGILYAENSLTSNAFPEARVKVVNMLVSQLAISLEHAKLFRKLKASDEKHAELLDRLPSAVLLLSLKSRAHNLSMEDLRYEYVSAAAEEIFGYPKEYFLTTPDAIRGAIHSDHLADMRKFMQDLQRGIIAREVEYRILTPDKKGTKIISQTNYGVYDETGRLVAVQFCCTDITAQRKQKLLERVLPAKIVAQLEERGIIDTPSKYSQSVPEVTIMFADIVGFTDACNKAKDPATITQTLNELFTAFDQLTEKAGLQKIKTIGDAYMVAGGIPEFRADHYQAMLMLAVDMVECCKRVSLNGQPLAMRFGVAKGPITACIIGKMNFVYDVLGATVNLAARLEATGHPGEIHITKVDKESLQSLMATKITVHENMVLKGFGTVETCFIKPSEIQRIVTPRSREAARVRSASARSTHEQAGIPAASSVETKKQPSRAATPVVSRTSPPVGDPSQRRSPQARGAAALSPTSGIFRAPRKIGALYKPAADGAVHKVTSQVRAAAATPPQKREPLPAINIGTVPKAKAPESKKSPFASPYSVRHHAFWKDKDAQQQSVFSLSPKAKEPAAIAPKDLNFPGIIRK